MSINKKSRGNGDASRRRKANRPELESLEGRAMLATSAGSTTFVAPSLAGLMRRAEEGTNTAPAAVDRMLTALSTQLTAGPLADLTSGAVDQSGAIDEVQTLLTSFDDEVDAALLPTYPNVDRIIKLGGDRVLTGLQALGVQSDNGLIATADVPAAAAKIIDAIGSGPARPFHATPATIAGITQAFESEQATLADALGTSAATPLTIAQAQDVLAAEATAYQAEIDAVVVTHPNVRQALDTATTTLMSQVAALPSTTSADSIQAQFQAATATFSSSVKALGRKTGG